LSSFIISDLTLSVPTSSVGGVGAAAAVAVTAPDGSLLPFTESQDAAFSFLSALLACLPQSRPSFQPVSNVPVTVLAAEQTASSTVTANHAQPESDVPDRSAPGRPLGRAPDSEPRQSEEANRTVVVVPPVLLAAVPEAVAGPPVVPASASDMGQVTTSAPLSGVLDAVADIAPPAGPSLRSADPARPSTNGPLLPPPARAESAILSAREFPPAQDAPHVHLPEAPTEPQPRATVGPGRDESRPYGNGAPAEADGAAEPLPRPSSPIGATAAVSARDAAAPRDSEPVASPEAASRPALPSAPQIAPATTPQAALTAAPAVPQEQLTQLDITIVQAVQTSRDAPAVPVRTDSAPETTGRTQAQTPTAPAEASAGAPRQQDAAPEGTEAVAAARPDPPTLPRERGEKELRAARATRAPALVEPLADQANPAAAIAARPLGDVRHAGPVHEVNLARSLVDLNLLDQIGSGALKATQLSRVTIQLYPPDLGSVAVAVESRDGRLCAHFHSTHPFVQTWIESHAPALRAHLANAGVGLQDITVSTSAQDNGFGRHQPPLDEQFAWRGPQQTDSGRHAMRQNVIGDNVVDCFA